MAARSITVDTELYGADRLTNSTNGNPRYELHTADGPYRTQSDAACSYDVDNVVRRIPDGGSLRVRLTATPSGRVWKIEQAGPATEGHAVERGTPAYWIIPGPTGGQQYVPVTVVSVEQTPDGRMVATYHNRGAGFQSRAEIGTEIVARAATGKRAGHRVTLRPSFGVPTA